MNGLIVDLFAGYGGASLGIRDVCGRDPDIAMNHDATACAVHAANHPNTKHLQGNVWHYAPRDVVGDRHVTLLWASPTCTDFSQAKGAPLDRKEATRVRALAWVVVRWARDVAPSIIVVENVPAFEKWGPLDNEGKPNKLRRGFTFRRWVSKLRALGYEVDWREISACDHGAPTSRSRLFIVARRDGLPIAWPEASHGPGRSEAHRGAHEVIDWGIPAPSIFHSRRKPLVPATLARIATGIRRFVLDTPEPWIMAYYGTATGSPVCAPLPTVTTHHRFALVVPSLIHVSNGERKGQKPRTYDLRSPLGTVVAGGIKHALVTAHIMKNFGGHASPGLSMRDPLGTVTTRDHHALVVCSTIGDRRPEVRALLERFGPPAPAQRRLFDAADDYGRIRVLGGDYAIADVGMRLLVPRELARSHDFEDSLALERDVDGKAVSLTKQVRLVGNSVARRAAAAVLRTNFRHRSDRVAA